MCTRRCRPGKGMGGTEFLGTVENLFLRGGPLTRFHTGNRFFPIRDFLCFTLMVYDIGLKESLSLMKALSYPQWV